MAKDKKERNPADAFRKEQRKKEIIKAKKERTIVNEVRGLLNDPRKIDEEIEKVQKQSDEFKLDKSLKNRLLELKHMKTVALKKQQILIASGKRSADSFETEQNPPRVQSSALPSPVPLVRRPEESVYYHPLYNQSGAPPPGQPVMYKPLGALPQPTHPTTPSIGIPPPPRVVGGPVQGSYTLPPPPPLSSTPRPPMHSQFSVSYPRLPAPLPAHTQHAFPYMVPPPPPPRPSFGAPVSLAVGQTPSQTHNMHVQYVPSAKSAASRPKPVRVPLDDPLDPSGSGYTERFGQEGGRTDSSRPQATANAVIGGAPRSRPRYPEMPPEALPDTSNHRLGGTPSFAVPLPGDNCESVESRAHNMYNMPGEDDHGGNDVEHPPFSPAVTVPAILTAEEIMRRRFQVPAADGAEEDTALGPHLLPSSDRDSDCQLSPSFTPLMCGASGPPEGYEGYADELLRQFEQQQQQWEEEDDVEDVAMPEPHIESRARPPAAPSGLPPPLHLNLSMGPPSSAASGGGLMDLLGCYGDDDEDSDGDQDEHGEGSSEYQGGGGARDGAGTVFSVPVSNTVPIVAVGPAPSATQVTPVVPAIPQPVLGLSASHHVLSTVAPADPLSVARPGFVNGPKIVKTDAAVTRLVPNVLRVKRHQQGQSGSAQSKTAKFVPQPPALPPSVAPVAPADSASIEDAYNSFLSEISELGGL